MMRVSSSHSFRFIATAAANLTGISAQSLALAMGSIGRTNNALVTSWVSSVKVNQVRIWAPPNIGTGAGTSGFAQTVAVNWSGLTQTPDTEMSNTSTSTSEPPFISCRPPKMSLGSFWQLNTGMTNLFAITCPAGSLIEVSVSGRLSNDVAGVTNSGGNLATVIVGTTYYLALDNNGANTHNFVPVSLPTTF